MTSPHAPLRIGILSAANIARTFIPAIANSSEAIVTTVASRDIEKAKTFAQEMNVPHALGFNSKNGKLGFFCAVGIEGTCGAIYFGTAKLLFYLKYLAYNTSRIFIYGLPI